MPRAVERYKRFMHDLGEVLYRKVAAARQHIKTLVGSIQLQPKPEGYLEAELRRNLEALIQPTHGNKMQIGMVAGDLPPIYVPDGRRVFW